MLPGYDYEARANPFVTFSAIPAKARYQFLLDHAEYFTRTFIRGPVCRGQIATDVIRDQFWVMYQDPANDLFITDPKYRKKLNHSLACLDKMII
nr:fatty acid cis/trans isomerase [Methylophaga marina]